ncbi:LLM class flavin-dependent oxidoreductase [Paenibacillus naphthalenovorans]|uniref:LLM class flavin-dependent oxidoreductase n=1 Tax=Paenibacillus naphthalenovorans TaxID=162209 RepID=UPI003D291806
MSLKFAYWVPNVSGGLVISKIPQKTGWTFEDNARYAKQAEEAGFEYALLQTRFIASYGAENQLEAITLASALAAVTTKLKLIAAVLPGLWHPGPIAKAISTLDEISKGRAAVNVVSGWFKGEFYGYGEPWLDHDERYRRSEEFIRVKTGLIGTAEQIADRIIELKKIGVNLILTGFLHYDEDIRIFGEKVIPLVRAKEAALLSAAAQ